MYIGVDIGGSKILAALAGADLKIIDSVKSPTPKDPRYGLDEVIRLVGRVAEGRQITAIGVAAPGPLDRQRGLILNTPNIKWGGAPVVKRLQKAFAVPVTLENDANAAALAETTLGAAKGIDNVLYVTISTGIGTGLILNGQIHHGAHDIEGGHIVIDPHGPECGCGGKGHFEAIVSGPAIHRRFGRHAYEIKDKGTWDLIAKDMAMGLAGLIAATSPDCLVIGGGVGVHYKHFRTPLEKHLKEHYRLYPLPKMVKAQYVETAAVIGALLIARDNARPSIT